MVHTLNKCAPARLARLPRSAAVSQTSRSNMAQQDASNDLTAPAIAILLRLIPLGA